MVSRCHWTEPFLLLFLMDKPSIIFVCKRAPSRAQLRRRVSQRRRRISKSIASAALDRKPRSSTSSGADTVVYTDRATTVDPKRPRKQKGRVWKAGLAALNKELYNHIYSCRKTLRRSLTFVQRTVVFFLPLARLSLVYSKLLILLYPRLVTPCFSSTLPSATSVIFSSSVPVPLLHLSHQYAPL